MKFGPKGRKFQGEHGRKMLELILKRIFVKVRYYTDSAQDRNCWIGIVNVTSKSSYINQGVT